MSGYASQSATPRLIDLLHRGYERVIGSWLVGDVIVDPGPQTCLTRLLDALGDVKPRALALTHVHLDHAGACGSLCERFPDLEVWVHERGAPHLIDPSKLLSSAGRLYGEEMSRLWGEVLPVGPERVRVLAGGEQIAGFDVIHTPGHASHHVSYMHAHTGWAFTGDVTGVRYGADGPVLAPTPPPDVDLEAWQRSLERIRSLAPRALVPTHFGVYTDVENHLNDLHECLARFADRASSMSEHDFSTAMAEDIRTAAAASLVAVYERAVSPGQSYQGLIRYLSKRVAVH